jgi:hypothetical protein
MAAATPANSANRRRRVMLMGPIGLKIFCFGKEKAGARASRNRHLPDFP